MKRLLSIFLCLVTCLCCSLTAFAGGPRTAEDIAAAGHTDNIAAVEQLADGLSAGTTYSLVSMASTDSELFTLNVWGGKDSDGTKVDMWEWDGTKEQRFRLISSGSYYKLEAVCSSSGRVLDAYRPLTNGCNVDLWSSNDNEAQQLVIKGNSSEGYVIKLAYNQNLALTAVNLSNDGAVQFKTYSEDKANQKWMFIKSNATLQRTPHPNFQNKDHWCWAAVAKIVAAHNGGGLKSVIDQAPQMLSNTGGLHKEFYGKVIVNGTTKFYADGAQYAIVKNHYKNDADNGGSVDDVEEALIFASTEEVTPQWDWQGENTTLKPTNINTINTELKAGRYVVGYVDGPMDGAHYIVLEAYDGDYDIYTVFNPWDNKEMSVKSDELFGEQNDYVYLDYSKGRMFGYILYH